MTLWLEVQSLYLFMGMPSISESIKIYFHTTGVEMVKRKKSPQWSIHLQTMLFAIKSLCVSSVTSNNNMICYDHSIFIHAKISDRSLLQMSSC